MVSTWVSSTASAKGVTKTLASTQKDIVTAERNKKGKNKTFVAPTRKRLSPILEKGANPKNGIINPDKKIIDINDIANPNLYVMSVFL